MLDNNLPSTSARRRQQWRVGRGIEAVRVHIPPTPQIVPVSLFRFPFSF